MRSVIRSLLRSWETATSILTGSRRCRWEELQRWPYPVYAWVSAGDCLPASRYKRSVGLKAWQPCALQCMFWIKATNASETYTTLTCPLITKPSGEVRNECVQILSTSYKDDHASWETGIYVENDCFDHATTCLDIIHPPLRTARRKLVCKSLLPLSLRCTVLVAAYIFAILLFLTSAAEVNRILSR